MATMQENEEYLKSNPDLARKIYNSGKAMVKLTLLFESLCPWCQRRVMQNPRMPLQQYCCTCQEKAKKVLADLTGDF